MKVVQRQPVRCATSDKGIILYHRLLMENIDKVERGEDPMFTIRDIEENVPFIHVERERQSTKLVTTPR